MMKQTPALAPVSEVTPDLLLNGLPMGVMVVNGRGVVLQSNRQASALLNFPGRDITGQNIADVFPTGHAEIMTALRSKRQAAGLILPELEHCFVQFMPLPESGSGAVLSIFDSRLWKPYMGQGAAVDPLSPYLSRIIDASSDGITITNRHGVMVKVNQSAADIVGVKPAELEGRHVSYLIKKNLASTVLSLDVLRSRQTISKVVDHRRTGKQILSTAAPIFNANGEVDLVVINERDITSITNRDEIHKQQRKSMDKFLDEFKINESNLISLERQEMIAESPAMCAVMGTAMVLAHHDVSHVLINGESGTGKSLLAQYIHLNSRRVKEPFVHINCAALPEPLLEAELFGYEKGAFTGADPNGKAGLLETAGKGTLFLDEIGEMPLSIQAKLLTFLDAGEFRRIGGGRVLKAECSVITATNQNLEMLVKCRQFRPDLSFRLMVFSLAIPPLRRRPEDIINLAKAALDKFNRKYRTSRSFDPLAWDVLKSYHYPGNVRELFNIIHQAVLLSDKKSIGAFLKATLNQQAPREEVQAQPAASAASPPPARARKSQDSHLPPLLDTAKSELEKNALLQAMAKSRNTRDIASYLGISQASVSRKLRKHGLMAPGIKKISIC